MLFLLYLLLVGTTGLAWTAWLGLFWAILFNVVLIAASNLATIRYGIIPAALGAILISQTTDNPALRYVLSMSVFALLSLVAAAICRLPPWTIGQSRGSRPRTMSIRGILALTTLAAIALAAHAEYAERFDAPVWLPLVRDELPLVVTLLIGSSAALVRVFPGVARILAAGMVFAVPAASIAISYLQDPSYSPQVYRDRYLELLPLYAVAALSTFVFNWSGRLDRYAKTARDTTAGDTEPPVETLVENQD